MKVFAYVRVSTDEQEGSLIRQRSRAAAYCALKDLDLPIVFVDEDVSARKTPLADRPGGGALLAALGECRRAGTPAHVLALRHDRLWRSVTDGLTTLEKWRRTGVTLHLVDQSGLSLDTSTALGWFFCVQLLAQAELEARLTGERISAAHRHTKAAGGYTGGAAPYGSILTAEGTLEPHEGEAATVEAAKVLQKSGLSLRKVGDALAKAGHVPRGGGNWHAQVVKKMVESAPR